jgi:iron complex transport system substrate-binding protein
VKLVGKHLVWSFISLCCLSSCSDPGDAAGAAPAPQHSLPGQYEDLRIVTLAPHLAELVWTAGAGHLLVGVSAYTDYPEALGLLPAVGDAFALDQERLAMLKPDMLLAWRNGTPRHIVDELQQRGYRVEVIRTESLADVGDALRQIGALTGYEKKAALVATEFEEHMLALADGNAAVEPVRVFYQVARRPLYTVNGGHYVSDLIGICGGLNVFADLSDLAPMISVEAVLQRDPEVLLASADAGADAFSDWDRWPEIAANKYANRFMIPADEIGRATPRLLVAAKAICATLEQARRNKDDAS